MTQEGVAPLLPEAVREGCHKQVAALLQEIAGEDCHKQAADFAAVSIPVDNNNMEVCIEDSNKDNNTQDRTEYSIVDSSTRMDSRTK